MKCPFHEDSHASAAINYDGAAFICHGCGVKGDVYKLIQHKEGGNYRAAIKFAETVLTTGNTTVRKQDRNSRRISGSTESIGRRSKSFSLGRSRRTPS
jgi:DNA primase